MLETAVASLRFGASMTLGTRFSLRSLERLVGAMLETTREFGAIGAEGADRPVRPSLRATTTGNDRLTDERALLQVRDARPGRLNSRR